MGSGTDFRQNNGAVVETDCMAIGGDLKFEWVVFSFNVSRGTDFEQLWMNIPSKQVEI